MVRGIYFILVKTSSRCILPNVMWALLISIFCFFYAAA